LGKNTVFWGIFSGGCWFLGVKTGFGRLICRVWANQAGKKRSKTFKNVRKYSKIFKNIQILSGNVQKYSKIFKNFAVLSSSFIVDSFRVGGS